MTNEQQRAVSIYGQNEGMEDFPVLKAFQQYIDAEQEKARKRILSLGVFFGAILIVVIAVFLFMLYGVNTRNQALSDRLVEYAMQEARRHQEQQAAASVKPAVSQSDEALKAMTATLVSIQKKLETPEAPAKPVTSEFDEARERKLKADLSKVERAQKQLEEEKALLAKEKERFHQIEMDRQRRKLYPELYSASASPSTPASSEKSVPQTTKAMLSDEDIQEIIQEADAAATEDKAAASKAVEDAPVEYFKDDATDYTIPVDIKGRSTKIPFTVPAAD